MSLRVWRERGRIPTWKDKWRKIKEKRGERGTWRMWVWIKSLHVHEKVWNMVCKI
jgi:hypothetical protein